MKHLIKSIGIENFKSFKDYSEINLAPITIFVGQNNSGKSTFLQSMKIIKDNFSQDGRNKVDLESFLSTKFNTGTLRERYGNINNFVFNESDSKSICISYNYDDDLFLKTIKVILEIEVNNNIGSLVSMKVSDPLTSTEYLNCKVDKVDFTRNNLRDSDSSYFLKVNQLAFKKTFFESLNKKNDWIDKIVDIGFEIENQIVYEINELIKYHVDHFINLYPYNKIIEYAEIYIEVHNTFKTINRDKLNKGFETLHKFFNGQLNLTELDELDTYTKSFILELFECANLTGIIGVIEFLFFDYIQERGYSWENVESNIEIEKNKISIRDGFFSFSNYKSEESNFKEEHQSVFKLRNNQTEEICSKINGIVHDKISRIIPDNLSNFFSTNEDQLDEINLDIEDIFEFKIINILKDIEIYGVNGNYKNNLLDHYTIIHTSNDLIGSLNFLNLKNILSDKDKIFVKKFKELLNKNFKKSKKKFSFNSINIFEDFILKKFDNINIYFLDKKLIPSILKFFPDEILIDELNLKSLKYLHFVIKSGLRDYSDIGFMMHNFIKGFSKNHIINKIKSDKDFEKFDESINFFLKFSIFNFLHVTGLTRLISDFDMGSLKTNKSTIEFLLAEKEILEGNIYDRIYNDILEDIDCNKVLSIMREYNSSYISPAYEYFHSSMSNKIFEIHNEMRYIFENQIFYLPAIKTQLKRYASLYRDDSDPLIKLINNDSILKYNNSYSYINKYLSALGVYDRVHVAKDDEKGIGIISLESSDGKLKNIVDEGHGISQLILLCHMLSVAGKNANASRKTFFIEEPEISLHPSLQSKLADVFKLAVKDNNIQIIVETHSEYLIRKLQYLTAKGELEKGDVAIYYFNPIKDNKLQAEERFYKIEIESNGTLTKNFGSGFFDEANNIALELFFESINKNN